MIEFPPSPTEGTEYESPNGDLWIFTSNRWKILNSQTQPALGFNFDPIIHTASTTGVQNIALPLNNLDENDILVIKQNVVQRTNSYTVAGTTLSIAATTADVIEIRSMVQVRTEDLLISDIVNALPVMIQPTVRRLSGSGNYTPPAGVLYIEVLAKAGGGGSAGSGGFTSGAPATPAAGSGGNGGDTTFGADVAGGGKGAIAFQRGLGGTSAVANAINIDGAPGTPGRDYYTYAIGGKGGGAGACSGREDEAGAAPQPNSGAGGTGAGSGNERDPGGGGGEGSSFRKIYANPVGPIAYVVGQGGTAGTAGVNGKAGVAGAAGFIDILEKYQ